MRVPSRHQTLQGLMLDRQALPWAAHEVDVIPHLMPLPTPPTQPSSPGQSPEHLVPKTSAHNSDRWALKTPSHFHQLQCLP